MPAPTKPKYTQEQRAEVLRMVREKGPSETARELGIPRGTVCWWARQAGVKSDGPQNTRAATEAASAKNAAKRAQLAADLLDDAAKLRASVWEPQVVWTFTGFGEFRQATIRQCEPKAKRELLTAVGIAIDKSLCLERHDSDSGQAAALDVFLDDLRNKS